MGIFLDEELGGRNVEGTCNQSFSDDIFLSQMMVGYGIKVSVIRENFILCFSLLLMSHLGSPQN
jgi:hypothetical protein